jgi:hypothetical protein
MTIRPLCGYCGNTIENGGLAPKEIRAAWNDGYSAAISNALDAGLITEEQSYDLLEELSRLED